MNATEIAGVTVIGGTYIGHDERLGIRVSSVGMVFGTMGEELIVEVYLRRDGLAERVIPWHAVVEIRFAMK